MLDGCHYTTSSNSSSFMFVDLQRQDHQNAPLSFFYYKHDFFLTSSETSSQCLGSRVVSRVSLVETNNRANSFKSLWGSKISHYLLLWNTWFALVYQTCIGYLFNNYSTAEHHWHDTVDPSGASTGKENVRLDSSPEWNVRQTTETRP